MNRKPFKRDELIAILTQICACAQNHSGDEEAWGPRNSVELEQQMGHVSFVVACFLSDYFDDGVDWDIVLKQLIGRVMSDAEWTDFLERLLSQMESAGEHDKCPICDSDSLDTYSSDPGEGSDLSPGEVTTECHACNWYCRECDKVARTLRECFGPARFGDTITTEVDEVTSHPTDPKYAENRVKPIEKWRDEWDKQKRNRAEKGWGASEKSLRYRAKSVEVNVTKFEKMGDHPKVILGLPFQDDEVGNYFEPYSGDVDPAVVFLKEGDDPFKLPEDVCVPIVSVLWRGYQAVNTGRYIVEEGDHVVGVFTKHQLDRRYKPVPK